MKKRVLVVENDPGILKVLGQALEQKGYQVLSASDRLEGLRVAQEEPDVLILEIMLPKLDGFEVCDRLRRRSRTSRLPILMLSAKRRDSDKETELKLGADGFLVKPVSFAELMARMGKSLAKRDPPSREKGKAIAFNETG